MLKRLLLFLLIPLATLSALARSFQYKYIPDGWEFDFVSEYTILDEDAKTCEVTNGPGKHFYTWDGIFMIPEIAYDNGVAYKVVSIGKEAFQHWTNIEDIRILAEITTIKDGAFRGCSYLERIKLPSSIISVGKDAFMNCSNMKSINIPASLDKIGSGAFFGCSNLIEFNVDTNNANFFAENGVLFYSKESYSELIFYPAKKEEIAYDIPNYVKKICEGAFFNCVNLKSITIPNSVTTIGGSAFQNCSNLAAVDIPNSVIEIGNCAFADCENLNEITLPNPTSGDATIAPEAFIGCKKIQSLTIPWGIMSIGYLAFADCTELKDIIYLSSACQLSHKIFDNCGKIRNVYLASDFNLLSFVQPTDVNIYTFKQCVDEAKKYKLDANIVTMPGISVTESSTKCDELVFTVIPDEGASLTDVECFSLNGIKEVIPSGEYKFSDLEPFKKYSVGFSITNEYSNDWCLPIKFKTKNIFEEVTCEDATQSTLTVRVKTIDDSRISNVRVWVGSQDEKFQEIYNVDKNGLVKIKNLKSFTDYFIASLISFKGEDYHSWDYINNRSGKTLRVSPTLLLDLGPTSYQVTPCIMDKGDAVIESTEFTIDDVEYPERLHLFCNLPVGSKYYLKYNVNNESTGGEFVLPVLILNTLPARAASKDCAIICAETNMSEEEYGGGFEWRRYDAPEMVPSTFSPCPVANGHMEGRLKGLSQNTYYKYRPYYEDCNGDRTFGEWTAFITADADVYFEPTVYTYSAHSVTKTGATLVGYAIGGSEDVDEQGFEYWPIANSRATTEVKRVIATGQRMIVTLEDLEPGTRYAVRAFASTKSKTTYGEQQEFETDAEQIEDRIEQPTVEETEVATFDIFTIQGVCVRRNTTDLSGLKPGLYIANGRKILVR